VRSCVARFGVGEDPARGKGSHRMLVRVVQGREVRYPVPCHNENHELSRQIIKAIRRAFRLTVDDGVSDAEFYGD
jgi:predicted RNA binding protein YcfA (HicA-like mRNA interferase family)